MSFFPPFRKRFRLRLPYTASPTWVIPYTYGWYRGTSASWLNFVFCLWCDLMCYCFKILLLVKKYERKLFYYDFYHEKQIQKTLYHEILYHFLFLLERNLSIRWFSQDSKLYYIIEIKSWQNSRIELRLKQERREILKDSIRFVLRGIKNIYS